MELDLIFSDPFQVTKNEKLPDTVMLTFKNTHMYLQPEDQSLEALPEDYKLAIKMPPQMSKGLKSVQETAQTSSNNAVIVQLLITLLLRASM